MKHFFRKIHLWLSVPFGIVITLICFSGAMLVFEKELTRLGSNDIYKVDTTEGDPLPVDVVAKRVARTLPDGVRVTGVTVSEDPTEAYSVGLSKPRRASVYVDQYTGEIKGRQERTAFFATMFKLHRWLLDSGRPEGRPAWGKIIVGVSTIMFIVALVSGVVIWWPKNRQTLRKRLTIKVRKGSFLFWKSLHVAGGMYVLILLLAMALTGLTWSFSWYNKAFYALFGVEVQQNGGGHASSESKSVSHNDRGGNRKGHRGHGEKHREAATQPEVWQRVYDRLHADNPHASSITIGDGTASVSLAKFGNTRAADRYTFDKRTGRITSVTKYADSEPSGKLRGWIFSVHTGSFGGLFTRILWFIAALLGAVLPVTGYYLWIRRLAKKGHHGVSRPL